MTIKQILKDMVEIPAGEVLMGSDEGVFDEVRLEAFSIGKYPVTQNQYRTVMETNPSKIKGKSRPVETVSWYDAQEFCQRLTELAGESKTKFKLPSEAQWEYACRAGSDGKWCFGDDEAKLEDYAWYNDNSKGQTHPVGEKKPNDFGLYDMHGNVWEWCEDHWHGNYKGAPTDGSPRIDEGAKLGWDRVRRGGCWKFYAYLSRSACRDGNSPYSRIRTTGFRICSGRRK